MMNGPDPEAHGEIETRSGSGSGGKGWGPKEHLKRLEAHRFPLLRAAWEATRSHFNPMSASQVTGLPPASIHQWVVGTAIPALDKAELLARALGRPDLAAWLAEGQFHLERLRRAAGRMEHERQGPRSHRRRLARARLRGAEDAIADYFQGLRPARQKALLRRLKKLAPPQP